MIRYLVLFLTALLLPTAAFASECEDANPSGFVSANSSQLFDDGFRASGENPTIKAAASIPVEGCLQAEVFVNKEVGGTKSDELDVGASYTVQAGPNTTLRGFVSYYAMRDLPDIIETSASVTQDLGGGQTAKVAALRYTRPNAADGFRLTASYTRPVTESLSLEVGALHEEGLGLPRDINALFVKPRFDLGNNLGLSGSVIIPTMGEVRAAVSIGWRW